MEKKKKSYIFLSLLLGLLGIIIFEIYIIYNKINIFTYFSNKKQVILDNNKEVVVELYTVSLEEKNIIYNTYGSIVGEFEADLAFVYVPEGGTINYIAPKREVTKGELLISLDTILEESRKSSFETNLEIKKKKLENVQKLVKNGILSPNDEAQLKGEIAELISKLYEVEVRIKRMSLYAIQDGYFFLNNNTSAVGAHVKANQPVGHFFSKKKFIKFYLPHEFLNYIIKEKEILEVLFFPEYNNSSEPLKGRLHISLETLRPLTNNENENKNSLCEGLAELDKEDIPPYFLNQAGKISIKFNYKESYILVPEIAVFNRGIKSYIYTVQDGFAILTEIEVMGPAEKGFFKINKNSLSDNVTIVLRGLNKIHHMTKVIA